ncbi:DUF547 domain-containing protein [Acinetobacter baumannii]|uniref:DUF547 domain-containing protein n=1 Tax=Acinetobacter indicus TaxID=756892 RepID=A0AAW8YV70_9GAMM|nr:DUF547 domain-containing protein [Acinetobacter indicus]MDV4311766.1 DUF547 domain-containing protein [Acinetobacter indicus]MDV4314479.1 DUF547 domain-containing protein [Acinetobacter indicus]
MNSVLSRIVVSILSLSASVSFANFDHQLFDQLLKKHVVSLKNSQVTQVKYGQLKLSTEHQRLRTYLNKMGQINYSEFNTWSKDEQMTFLINGYNAWTIELILSKYPDLSSIRDLGSLIQTPWKKKFIPLLDKNYSLDEIEDQLRKYNDPRIHFAVNCASIGCPALRPEAYQSSKLDQQLEQATHLFLSDKKRNYIENDTIYISSIFKWYKKDFELGWKQTHSVSQFLSMYPKALSLNSVQTNALKQQKIKIKYLEYDWRLNKTP